MVGRARGGLRDWLRKALREQADNQAMTGVQPSRLLRGLRNEDGGFGPLAGAPSEAEPTALAAVALDDADARAWLTANQRADGGFGLASGSLVNDAATGLAAVAMDAGPGRERALDRLDASRAVKVGSHEAIPIDPSAVGWSWTRGSASWVEPTARALLAFRLLRPSSPAIEDGVALLRDRETVGGGWNYGNRIVLDEVLPPFVQPTAVALMGLVNLDPELEGRGLATLRSLWREESAGGLNVATTAVALRLHGEDREAARAERVLDRLVAATGLRGDAVALGWATLATSDTWAALGAA